MCLYVSDAVQTDQMLSNDHNPINVIKSVCGDLLILYVYYMYDI